MRRSGTSKRAGLVSILLLASTAVVIMSATPVGAAGETAQATALQAIASGGGGSMSFIKALCPGSPSASGPSSQTVGSASVTNATSSCSATGASSGGSAAATGNASFGAWSSSCDVNANTTAGSVTVNSGLAPTIPDGTVVTAPNTVVSAPGGSTITLNEVIVTATTVTRNAIHARAPNGAHTIIGQVVCLRPPTTLSISKVGPPGAFPNQEFNFTITVTNTGTANAFGVQVVDTLPATGSFVSSSPAGTPATPAPGGTYTINLPDIPAGASVVVTIRWKAPAGAAMLVNSATVSATNAPTAGPAAATVEIGTSGSCIGCGVVAGGTGLRNRDQGTITIGGIPGGASVGRAVLVWGILYSGATPPNTITFAGTTITADVTATVSGNLCWGDTNTIGYAADVTPLVTGNGTYVVSNPPRGTTRPDSDPNGALPFTDGASLIVFYNGGGANNQVKSDFTYDTNTDSDSMINRTFSGISSVGGAASLILAGPDGQNNAGETFTLTGSGTITLTNTFDGSDPQFGPSFGIGNLWDTDAFNVTSILPAGQSTLSIKHTLSNDCIGVSAAVLQVAQ